MNSNHSRHLVETASFAPTEPFYDICESWAEEPSTEAWDLQFAALYAWVVRAN